MADGKYNILFLCTGNSARSIIAEAIMNRVGAGRFTAYSAGSHPKGAVNPNALALLDRLDYQTGGFRSKSWNEFARPDAPKLDFVITVCDDAAGEICPAWPGQPMTAHWGMPDPAAVEGSQSDIALAFAETYRMLNNRIGAFANLKMSGLDRLSLQTKVRDIGKSAP
jgi:protein-tyrosine-phosphatase